jgi:hypothetical protein
MKITQSDPLEKYGPLIGGPDLVKVLGYRSNASFRRAVRLGIIGVRVFDIPGRKGKYAKTQDVVAWLKKLTDDNPGK